ncbi:GAF domain-containing sensor histidine kinase [Caballeronia sp. dw_276]|jgi:signal transduction histidine kinase|uniref:GAF domain-containing sensor histidine kinase n=1 Tax=Caballeronia sp. dw_276 TaxID=2719795 RepID=UPI001BD2842E|nr:GAF domain-containing sensor histidine kinase [Caballeronia sp. dw_276]
MSDSDNDIARDVAAVARIGAVPSMLRVICKNTGLGFAAVARVTEGTWTACAVQDNIEFGLVAGGQLDVHTTLCSESRARRVPIVVDHASADPVYQNHHTPRIYNIESYISVPIILPNGEYFGNLCAIDPRPAVVSDTRTLTMFTLFAELIALQLDSERERSATEAALLDERATAELREQFIAVLGHDLRNPLAAVGATAELLTRRDDPGLVSLGTRLRTTTKRMSRLIDDVLDFARGRLGGGLGVTLAPARDIADALADIVAELRTANPGRVVLEHIEINRSIDCDRGRVQQLLSNLLANALHHGAPDKPVLVDACVEADDLVISVSNSGYPIVLEDLQKVFEPYWRPATSQPGGGLGLGLYICSQIVKDHGGLLSVSSSAEAGTCFVARIPVACAR